MNCIEPEMENKSVVNYQIAENTDPARNCARACDSYTNITGFYTSST